MVAWEVWASDNIPGTCGGVPIKELLCWGSAVDPIEAGNRNDLTVAFLPAGETFLEKLRKVWGSTVEK